jgi:hypothetical protein
MGVEAAEMLALKIGSLPALLADGLFQPNALGIRIQPADSR